jgi:hypothetical protein
MTHDRPSLSALFRRLLGDPEYLDESIIYDGPNSIVEIVSTTACKHGRQDCPNCGTTSRRDVTHKTRGGRGSVGKLRKKPR